MNYCLLAGDGEIIVEGQVENSQQGFAIVYELLQKEHAEVIFEATGVYSRRWQYFLEFHETSYVRMNPLAAKKEMDELRNTKNDKIDAKKLAVLQLRNRHESTVMEDNVYRNYVEKAAFIVASRKSDLKQKIDYKKSLRRRFIRYRMSLTLIPNVFTN